MGRNSAVSINWTQIHDGTSYITTHYCQVHSTWDQREEVNLVNTTDEIKKEMQNRHGCVEQ